MSERHDLLRRAQEELEREVTERTARALRWLRQPRARLLRIPLGLLCMVAGFFWFLPVLGLWMFPLGLVLLAEDVPFLRKPVGRLLLWLIQKYRALRARWRDGKAES